MTPNILHPKKNSFSAINNFSLLVQTPVALVRYSNLQELQWYERKHVLNLPNKVAIYNLW